MTTIACLMAWTVALLLLPILLLARATESDRERIRRLRRSGLSQRAIAQRLGISRHRVARVPA
jgi:DNA-binding CsgD family transcriptional regulator